MIQHAYDSNKILQEEKMYTNTHTHVHIYTTHQSAYSLVNLITEVSLHKHITFSIIQHQLWNHTLGWWPIFFLHCCSFCKVHKQRGSFWRKNEHPSQTHNHSRVCMWKTRIHTRRRIQVSEEYLQADRIPHRTSNTSTYLHQLRYFSSVRSGTQISCSCTRSKLP